MSEAGPYFKLKDMIYRGVLPAGKRLIEHELAGLLMVSRIPLREALARLQAEGLVHGGNRMGTFVIDITPKDIAEINSIRLILEPPAARLATENVDAILIRRLRRLCLLMGKLSGENNLTKLAECDYDFHWTIVQASKHTRLIRAFEISQVRILGRPDESEYLKTAAPDQTEQEHTQIVDIIASGDVDAAEKVIFDHVKATITAFGGLYETSRSRKKKTTRRASGSAAPFGRTSPSTGS
ncbi:MAG: transcriptional regulator, GntR family [Verrucomicrobia bacterium]|nr:transcriptional regulator, GntR family [Verrucomicrobiota bacterium]